MRGEDLVRRFLVGNGTETVFYRSSPAILFNRVRLVRDVSVRSLLDAPEQCNAEHGHDREKQLERWANPEVVRETIVSQAVDEEVRLVADRAHERCTGGKINCGDECKWICIDARRRCRDRNHEDGACVVADQLGN